MDSGWLTTLTTSRLGANRPRFYPVSRKLCTFLQRAKLPDRTQQQEALFHIGRLICGEQLHATRKRCDRAKPTTRLSLRVSLYAQTLTSESWTELASTHIDVYNVCKLTSKRLRTDFYTFANWPETFAKRLVGETTDYQSTRASTKPMVSYKCYVSLQQAKKTALMDRIIRTWTLKN